MTTAQLRLLRVFALELRADAVQQLDVALLWVLLQRGDEGPGHGACSLTGDLGILAVVGGNVRVRQCASLIRRMEKEGTYEV